MGLQSVKEKETHKRKEVASLRPHSVPPITTHHFIHLTNIYGATVLCEVYVGWETDGS